MRYGISFLLYCILSFNVHSEELTPIEVLSSSDEAISRSEKKIQKIKISDHPPFATDMFRQAMTQLPGIHTPEQTTEPWTILNYRGLGTPQESQNVMILQDGLPVGLDIYGSPDHYYSPPIPLMDEVELISGGSGLLYGPAPFASINFLSPRLNSSMPVRGRLNMAYGSYNLLSTVNYISGSKGQLSYWAGVHRKQGDGLQRTNGDFVADYVQWKINYYAPSNLILKSSFQGYNSDFGMPGGMALNKGEGLNTWGKDNRKATRKYNRLRVARAQMMVGFEKKVNTGTYLDTQLWGGAYRKYNKTQKGSGFGKIPTGTGNMINTTQAYGINLESRLRHKYDQHELTAGYLSYNTNSPSINEDGAHPDSNHGDVSSKLYRTTRAQALFLENRFTQGALSVTPGVRMENITLAIEDERSDTYNVVIGGVGFAYLINDSKEIYANASQSFKPVGYEDVLSQGNPNYTVSGDIEPSYNYSYEMGLKTQTGKVTWDNSLYYLVRQNIVATNASVITNGSSAHYHGFESSLEFDFESLNLFTNVNLMNARYRHGQFQGQTPGHAPSAILKAGFSQMAGDKFKVTLLGSFVNEHYSDDAQTDDYKVPSYTLYDLLFDYQVSNAWSLNGAINNIMDRKYYARVMPTGVMPTMGRNMVVGLNYRF